MLLVFRVLLVPVFALFLIIAANAAGNNCEVIRYASYCEIDNNRLLQTDSLIIQINNRTGEKYCEILLNSDRHNPVSDLTAWIEDKNGNIVRYLRNKEISESNYDGSSFYTDDYTLKFVLKHNDYPYRICYTYRRSFREFYVLRRWCPVIGLEVPTRSAMLSVSVPESYDLSILQNNVDTPVSGSEDGMIIRKWQTTYDGSCRKEILGDPLVLLPEIRVFPVHFVYGIQGSQDSWPSFGKWQFNLINGLDELPDSEKSRVQGMVTGIQDKKEIIRVLYHYLQDNTHYINVDIGIGGLKPYPASYVVQNKYGDCKALTIYMKALLKAAGIMSNYVLVNAGDVITPIYLNTPHQQFNHVILAVPLGSDTIWLENTSSTLPFGYSGSFTQNRYSLLVDEMNSHPVRIPALTAGDVKNSSRMDFYFNPGEKTNVFVSYTIKGPSFEKYCSLQNYGADDQNRIMHELLPFPVFDMNNWQLVKRGRDATTILLQASVAIPELTHPIGQEYYFSYEPLQIAGFESPKVRKLPMQIPYPVYICDTLIYHLSEGKKLTSFPEDKIILNKYGRFKTTFIEEGHSLVILREIELYPGMIPLEEYTDFYNFIAAIKSEEKLKILFQ